MRTVQDGVISERLLKGPEWAARPEAPATTKAWTWVDETVLPTRDIARPLSIVSAVLEMFTNNALEALPQLFQPGFVATVVEERDAALAREVATRAELRDVRKHVKQVDDQVEQLRRMVSGLASAISAARRDAGATEFLAAIADCRPISRSAEHAALARRVAAARRPPEDLERWARELAESVGELTD